MHDKEYADSNAPLTHEDDELLRNSDRLHTTPMGADRIKKNLCLDTNDVVGYCKLKISEKESSISRKGKNWYVRTSDCLIKVNAYSYTIITAHQIK